MSGTNPSSIESLLLFANLHAPVWEGNARDIGVSDAQAAQYKALTAAAQAAFDAVQRGKLQQKALVETQTAAIRALRNTNSSLLKTIRGFAQDAADPVQVFNKAQIPPPAAPAPVGPPSAAFDLNAALDILTGGLKLSWKATQNAPGAIYRVERSTTATPGANWSLIALTGSKFTIDTSVPVGTSRVLYRVVAQRGNLQSQPSGVLDIRFGTGPGEINPNGLKMAA